MLCNKFQRAAPLAFRLRLSAGVGGGATRFGGLPIHPTRVGGGVANCLTPRTYPPRGGVSLDVSRVTF
jgi:hypothetical protein